MKATELIGRDKLGSVHFHFAVEAVIDNQIMGHADAVRLRDAEMEIVIG